MDSKRYKPSRYYMYNSIEHFIKTEKLLPGKCLLVGDSLRGKGDDAIKIKNSAIIDMLPNTCQIIAPPYPDVDIQDLPYDDNTFDYVIADQVLEHVKKPWIAVEEVRRALKPGGVAILTSCLMQHIHGIPEDYFRFTPDGLKILCENFSVIEEANGHGSWSFMVEYFTKKLKSIIPNSNNKLEREALKNDGKFLLTVWIIARK